MISYVITAHNEGEEVKRTVDSIRANTEGDYEIVVVDDASTDECCTKSGADNIVRHNERVGVAYSRSSGTKAAKGDVFLYLDGHQRVSYACGDILRHFALQHDAITWPCVRGLEDKGWTGHGSNMRQKDQNKKFGFLGNAWKNRKTFDRISRSSTLMTPGYCIPRTVVDKVWWVDGLKGWGASESAVTVKAFFCDIDVLHVCGPMARHMFRKGKDMPYKASLLQTTRNHGYITRVCFDDRTWNKYWWPVVFKKLLKDKRRSQFDEPWLMDQHEAFQKLKVRPDEEYWYGLILTDVPKELG